MSSAEGESWSDSDNEQLIGEVTSVLLGLPDGLVKDGSDLLDAAVSRIGGHPVRLDIYSRPIIRFHAISQRPF
jgi:pre-rRNA-processing protein TSR4